MTDNELSCTKSPDTIVSRGQYSLKEISRLKQQVMPTVQAGGGLQRLHSADDDVTKWLKTYGACKCT